MKIIDRLFEYLNYQGIKPTAFEKQIGLSNGYLGKQKRRNADIGESVLINIIENSPLLSVNWLLFGSGQMLADKNSNKVDEPSVGYVKSTDINLYKLLNTALEERILEKDARIVELNDTIRMQQDYIDCLKKMTRAGPPIESCPSNAKESKSTH